jgi:ABC transporter, phosphonate, periplasmic substrate-binding protein
MRKTFIIILIIGLTKALVWGAERAEPHGAELFYFNPDSPQSNLSRLKRDMDHFLSEAGIPITFQPFTHLVDFERQLKENPPAFLFVPRWYVKKYGAALKLHPLLVPVRKGAAFYRKILLGSDHANLKAVQTPHPRVAMTSMGPDGDAMLNAILFSPHGVAAGKINAIIVPKDIDALFALALGQVDMALVVKENMEMIAKINPNILNSVRPLLESEPIPMPVLCFTEGVASTSDIKELKVLFLNGKAQESRSTIMEMLQINGWQTADH